MIKSIILSLALLSPMAMAQQQSNGLPPPPLKAWGIIGCGEYYVWIVEPNGDVRRFDRFNGPQDPEALKAFMAWVESTHTDDQDLIHMTSCPAKK